MAIWWLYHILIYAMKCFKNGYTGIRLSLKSVHLSMDIIQLLLLQVQFSSFLWISLFFFWSLQKKRGVHKLQYMSLHKPCHSTRNSDGTRFFVCNLLDMWNPTEVPIDCKAKEVTFCPSLNWLGINCQLRGLRIYIELMIMKKHEYCFLYFKVQLVYMKPFRNAIKLIVNILWYFLHLYVFGRCWVARKTQRTYQICIICIWYSFEIRTGFMNIIHLNNK